jgi:hypothetical protein
MAGLIPLTEKKRTGGLNGMKCKAFEIEGRGEREADWMYIGEREEKGGHNVAT